MGHTNTRALRKGRAQWLPLQPQEQRHWPARTPQRAWRFAVAYLTEVGEKGYQVTADGGGPGGTSPEVPASQPPAGED